MATTILHIIVGAHRPLTTAEMAIALRIATQPYLQSYVGDRADKDRVEELLPRLCGLFVFINHSRIYLIHQTAKEFLVQKDAQKTSGYWKHCLTPNDSETIMASICVNYLLLNELDVIRLKEVEGGVFGQKRLEIQRATNEEHRNDICDVEALLAYAAEHWSSHFRVSTVDSRSPTLKKVCSLYQLERSRFNSWFLSCGKHRGHMKQSQI